MRVSFSDVVGFSGVYELEILCLWVYGLDMIVEKGMD